MRRLEPDDGGAERRGEAAEAIGQAGLGLCKSVSRRWQWLRRHQWSNRVYADHADLVNHSNKALGSLTAETLRTVCAASRVAPPIQSGCV